MKQNEIIVAGSSGVTGRTLSVHRTVFYAFLVVGAISTVAITFNYDCKIHLKVSISGFQMDFDGTSRQI